MFSDWFTKKAYSYCIIYIKEQLSGRKNFWRIHTFNCTYMCIEAIACGKLPRIIIVQQPVHGMDEWLLACRLSFPNFGTIHLWVFTQNCNFQHYKICLTRRQIETERDRGEGSQVSPAFLGQIIHYQTACRTPSSALLCSDDRIEIFTVTLTSPRSLSPFYCSDFTDVCGWVRLLLQFFTLYPYQFIDVVKTRHPRALHDIILH